MHAAARSVRVIIVSQRRAVCKFEIEAYPALVGCVVLLPRQLGARLYLEVEWRRAGGYSPVFTWTRPVICMSSGIV